MTRPWKNPGKRNLNPGPSGLEADALPLGQWGGKCLGKYRLWQLWMNWWLVGIYAKAVLLMKCYYAVPGEAGLSPLKGWKSFSAFSPRWPQDPTIFRDFLFQPLRPDYVYKLTVKKYFSDICLIWTFWTFDHLVLFSYMFQDEIDPALLALLQQQQARKERKPKKLTPEQADAKRRKVWVSIAKKEMPKVFVLHTFWSYEYHMDLCIDLCSSCQLSVCFSCV